MRIFGTILIVIGLADFGLSWAGINITGFLGPLSQFSAIAFGLAGGALLKAAGPTKTEKEEAINKIKEDYETALKSSLCLMAKADGKVDDEEIKMIADLVKQMTNKEINEDELKSISDNLKNESVDQYLTNFKDLLGEQQKKNIIKALYYVASADGKVEDDEMKLLISAAGSLNMTQEQVKSIFSDDK